MLLHDAWHVLGVPQVEEAVATVTGSESDCRDICKIMVSAGRWTVACLYPPGSRSDSEGIRLVGVLGARSPYIQMSKIGRDGIKNGPYESYATPVGKGQMDIKAVGQMVTHIMGDWVGWIHDKYDQ